MIECSCLAVASSLEELVFRAGEALRLISPVFDAPLLLVEGKERVLVAADLHLGLEHELWLGGVSIPSQTEKILARLQGYVAEIKPDRLLLLGDLKHNVPKTSWQEKREIPGFLAPAFGTGEGGDRPWKS